MLILCLATSFGSYRVFHKYNIPILSEEHKEQYNDTYFIIDSIDGTHNFSRGFECFGIMVALVEKNETVFSIVELPILNKIYIAIKGKGAYLNRRKN